MTLLLDTHTFLFAVAQPSRLSVKMRQMLADSEVPRMLSVSSLWEITIKLQLGKLPAPPGPRFFEDQARELDARILPIDARHIHGLAGMPLHHKDPFDRMLIAQALTDSLTIATRDKLFKKYDVPTVW